MLALEECFTCFPHRNHWDIRISDCYIIISYKTGFCNKLYKRRNTCTRCWCAWESAHYSTRRPRCSLGKYWGQYWSKEIGDISCSLSTFLKQTRNFQWWALRRAKEKYSGFFRHFYPSPWTSSNWWWKSPCAWQQQRIWWVFHSARWVGPNSLRRRIRPFLGSIAAASWSAWINSGWQ